MIPQKPIKNPDEIANRIMNYLWGKRKGKYNLFGTGWDINSPSHKYWKRYCKRNFKMLKKLKWLEIYKLAKYNSEQP